MSFNIRGSKVSNNSRKSTESKASLRKEDKDCLRKLSIQKELLSGNRPTTELLEKDSNYIKNTKEHDTHFSDTGGILQQVKGHVSSTSKLSKIHQSSASLHSVLKSVNEELPNAGHDVKYTKLFLQKQGLYNLSIWSHLTNVLNKIIAEQPENVIDYFEEYSRKVKQERLQVPDTLRVVFVPSPHLESAKNILALLNSYDVKEDTDEPEVGEEEEISEPPQKMDLEEVEFYFRQGGVVIPEVQLFTLNIAMKKLAEVKKLSKTRFWGKFFGIRQDYFVMECELADEEYEKRIEEDQQADTAEAELLAAEQVAADEAETEKLAAEQLENEAIQEKESEAQEVDQETNKLDNKSPKNIDELDSIKTLESNNTAQMEFTGEKSEKTVIDSNEPRVSFNIPEESNNIEEEGEKKKEEDEDPLLPPLPPPNKLLKYKVPPLLKPVKKENLKVPSEKIGEGLNRKVYYVCNVPELEWTELPKVTPEQITAARQIKVYLTGDLDSKIITYPSFPGLEKNYLRTQIARISAATQVSPLGFYKFGEEGDEEEEEEVAEEEEEDTGGKTKYIENPKFQPIPVKDLIDPSFAFWVHHSQHILKQGRTEWWNAKKAAIGEDEEQEEEQVEEEEEENEGETEEKEIGPALLAPLSEDAMIDGTPAWTVRKTYNYNNEMAAAVIKSNLWPGSCTFAVGKKFENVYFGWGHKHSHQGFSPIFLPHPEYDYDLGPEIMEIQDPTVEVEETWRQAHKKKPPPTEEEAGEEGEEEEDDEEYD